MLGPIVLKHCFIASAVVSSSKEIGDIFALDKKTEIYKVNNYLYILEVSGHINTKTFKLMITAKGG